MLVDRVGRVTLTRSDPLEMIQPAKSPGTNEFRTTRFHEEKKSLVPYCTIYKLSVGGGGNANPDPSPNPTPTVVG